VFSAHCLILVRFCGINVVVPAIGLFATFMYIVHIYIFVCALR